MSFDPLPEPPEDYTVLAATIALAGPLFRVHARARGAVFYNPANIARFNAPEGEYGVMYASESEEGAFAETFVRHRTRPPVVDWTMLSQYSLSRFAWSRPLTLVDFAGRALTPLGLDARICSGDFYPLCQRWSRWIHDHPDMVDGIIYPARNAPHVRSVALFERVGAPEQNALVATSLTDSGFSAKLGDLLDWCGAVILTL